MKYLRRVGFMSSLLLVGTVGELLTPLPSEALTVTIDGRAVQLTTTSAACTSGYNLCSFIPPGTYGNWTVGDVSATNRARIMIGDNSAASSLDLLKLTGITFTPVVPAGTKTTTVVVTHTYNAGGGNPQGDYSWGYGMAGYLDPPNTENIVGDQLQQSGRGNFAGTTVALGLGLDTGKFATPSTNNLNGSVSKSRAATVVRANCNTGSARCAPTITQTFTITVVGSDKLVLSDSMIAAGGTCLAVQQVIPIPPGLYKQMLRLDPTAPNDVNKLSAWLATNGPLLKIEQGLKAQLHRLRKATGPGTCPEVLARIDEVVDADLQAEFAAAQASGAVPAESCADLGTCGTIVIKKETDSQVLGTFGFTVLGEFGVDEEGAEIEGFTLAATNTSTGSITFTDLAPGVNGGSRTIKETSFPVPHEDDGLSEWHLEFVHCVSTLSESGSVWIPIYVSEVLVGVKVDPLGNNDTLTCTFHNHHTHNGDSHTFPHPPHPPGF